MTYLDANTHMVCKLGNNWNDLVHFQYYQSWALWDIAATLKIRSAWAFTLKLLQWAKKYIHCHFNNICKIKSEAEIYY